LSSALANYHDASDDDPEAHDWESSINAVINNRESHMLAQDDVHHGIDTSVKELEVFAAQSYGCKPFQPYCMSIDHESWNKLDSNLQALWDKLSPEAKNLILSSARQKGINSIINKSTIGTGKFPPKTAVPPKPSGADSKNTRSMNEHASKDSAFHHHSREPESCPL
jgi:hypothetical protein